MNLCFFVEEPINALAINSASSLPAIRLSYPIAIFLNLYLFAYRITPTVFNNKTISLIVFGPLSISALGPSLSSFSNSCFVRAATPRIPAVPKLISLRNTSTISFHLLSLIALMIPLKVLGDTLAIYLSVNQNFKLGYATSDDFV